jgi:hypothetical protein
MILAEDIGGWLFAGLVLFGGLGAALLALGALVPAWKGHPSLALTLSAPGLILGLGVTIWLGYGLLTSNLHDPDIDLWQDHVLPWVVMAGPSLATSLLALGLLCYKRKRKRPEPNPGAGV